MFSVPRLKVKIWKWKKNSNKLEKKKSIAYFKDNCITRCRRKNKYLSAFHLNNSTKRVFQMLNSNTASLFLQTTAACLRSRKTTPDAVNHWERTGRHRYVSASIMYRKVIFLGWRLLCLVAKLNSLLANLTEISLIHSHKSDFNV